MGSAFVTDLRSLRHDDLVIDQDSNDADMQLSEVMAVLRNPASSGLSLLGRRRLGSRPRWSAAKRGRTAIWTPPSTPVMRQPRSTP